jgi:hypothetical protein
MTINKLITTLAITALIITSVSGITTQAKTPDNNGCDGAKTGNSQLIYTSKFEKEYSINPGYGYYIKTSFLNNSDDSGLTKIENITGCSNGQVSFSITKGSKTTKHTTPTGNLTLMPNPATKPTDLPKNVQNSESKCYDSKGSQINAGDYVSINNEYGKYWKNKIILCKKGVINLNMILNAKYSLNQKTKKLEYIKGSGASFNKWKYPSDFTLVK